MGNVGTEVSARFGTAHYVVQNDFGITVAQSRIVMVLYTYNVGRANVYMILMLLPFQVTMVPNYLVLNKLGLLDTHWALILPGCFSAFTVFIMARGFDAVPMVLLEAAALDGAGPFRTFWHVGLPLGMPGILSAMVLAFLEGWNAIEQPMTFLKDPSRWPLSLYLASFNDANGQTLATAMAASLIMLAPAVLIFRFGQQYLELGIQASGLKE